MSEQDQDSKTEEPTGKRLEDARAKGDVPISQEFKTWIMLVGATAVVLMFGPWMAGRVRMVLRPFIEQPHLIATDQIALRDLFARLAFDLLTVLAVPFGLFVVLGIAAPLVQHGFILTTEKMKPDINKINPMNGLQRYLSSTPWVELAKGLVKIGVVGAAVVMIAWPRRREFEAVMSMEVIGQLAYLMDIIQEVLVAVLVIVAVIAAADFAYQRWIHHQRMKMTKQEVRDENKQAEGDPQVKARIARLRVERARRRMMQAVPRADVVITNPTHYAVALKYDMEENDAPVVVAKGMDFVAKKIRELAEENDVTIVENPPLARALYAAVEVDEEIPPEHYKAVAEVIGYVMGLKGKLKKR